ncbi:MAG: DNA-binding domain-containing protein, partial [Pseudomonadota bacterium]
MPPDTSEGSAPARQHSIAQALNKQGANISAVHNGRGRPAQDRFRIYRNNVIVSLRDALSATFSTTRKLMGEDFFGAAAVAFAQDNRPSSPMIFRYGEDFPAFLSWLPGLKGYPFVPEVAALEYARLQATHAADAPPLAADALSCVPPEGLASVTFTAHPASKLLLLPQGGLGAWQ